MNSPIKLAKRCVGRPNGVTEFPEFIAEASIGKVAVELEKEVET